MSTQKATRESWKANPLPSLRSRLNIARTFTQQEYERILIGVVPEQMEDKWFIFVENDILYAHRSWTGYCIYQMALIKEKNDYRAGEAFVNRDESQYSGKDDVFDHNLLLFLIDHLLLGIDYPMPLPETMKAGIATELYYHNIIGAGRRKEPQTINLTIGGMLRWFGRWLIAMFKR